MNLVLTKNFHIWMRTILLGCTSKIDGSTSSTSGHSGVTNTIETLKDIEGEEFSSIYLDSTSGAKQHTTLNYWLSSGGAGTYFGIGNNNALATEDDHALGGGYISGTDYTVSQRAVSYPVMVNGKAQLTFSLSITAINDIVIGELGLLKMMAYASLSSAKKPHYLFGRVALDTPISLASGESATYQVAIEI